MNSMPNYKIYFLFAAKTKGIFFNPLRPEGIDFTPLNEVGARFVLRPSNPESNHFQSWKELDYNVAISLSATKEQYNFVASLHKNGVLTRVAEGISLPCIFNETTLINEAGECRKNFIPYRYLCPSDICEILDCAEKELNSKSTKFLKLLRWRQGIDAPSEILESHSIYWKVDEDNQDYYLVPSENGPQQVIESNGLRGITWDADDPQNLQALWEKDGIDEPLGHTLLREAIILAAESPRSAILIMTAAVETAVKMHISSIAPDTKWLLEEAQSPPVPKMFRKYIPLIHDKHENKIDHYEKLKPFFNKLDKLFEVRNKIAHTGIIPNDAPSIHDNLELVSNLLYLLDVLAGHEWAKSYANNEFCNALGWPKPVNYKTKITVKHVH